MVIKLSTDTFPRPESMADKKDPAVLYVQSFLLIRTIVGFIGILLPVVLIVGEAFFLKGGVHVRGSLSAYYHTSMRDVFVSSLCVTGFLLATYLSGQIRTWDFWLSLIAGVAVLMVVFFPTKRPGIASDAPLCGAVSAPTPPGCSPVQQELGETQTAVVHFTSATIFILSLAGICFLFGYREKKHNNNSARMWLHYGCCATIALALAWVLIGGLLNVDIWELTPLYIGEVLSVWAFGTSWLFKGKDLRRALRPAPPTAGQDAGTPREPVGI